MIQAEASVHKSYLHVVFKYPDLKEKTVDIKGYDAEALTLIAQKMVNKETKQYIHGKLSSWIKQRMYIFTEIDRAKMNVEAARIKVILGYHELAGVFTICKIISQYRNTIQNLAPSERSSHFNYYKKTIEPILDFCDQMSGGRYE